MALTHGLHLGSSLIKEQGVSDFERRGQLIADLKECSASRSWERGKLVHEAVIQNGECSNVYVASALISMYAKCGSMADARMSFDSVEFPNVVCWNALILGYVENGEGKTALDLFSQMSGVRNGGTFVAALKHCALSAKKDANSMLETGKVLHLLASIHGCDAQTHVEIGLLIMYVKCRSMDNACKVFDKMKECDAPCWTLLVSGYADTGQGDSALTIFSRMSREGCAPAETTYVAAFKSCLSIKENSRQVAEALSLLASSSGCDLDIYVQSTMIDVFGKCGSMENARRVFSTMKHLNVVSWTALISGYVNSGEAETALETFSRMGLQGCAPDTRTIVAALKACGDLAVNEEHSSKTVSIRRGRKIHLLALAIGCDADIYVQTILVDMYARCRSMDEARLVFDHIEHPNVVSWTALILGYAHNGESERALDLFTRLGCEDFEVNARTFGAVCKACTHLALEHKKTTSLERGRALHLLASMSGCDSDVFLESTLVDMYSKCECMSDARQVFEGMKHRDVVVWTALISGYVETGESSLALKLFSRMDREGCVPDTAVLITVLKACGNLGALEFGRKVHAELCSRKLERDVVVANSLVSFYAKCGSLAEAGQVFDSHTTRNLATWTALITGYSHHGDARGVVGLFERMLGTDLQPNNVTFLCVLTACSHAGLVERGIDYFRDMSGKYGVVPDVQHHNCMVDILGRANKLDGALALLRSMPFPSDAVSWMTVLGACHKWKYVQLGNLAFECLVKLDNRDAGTYELMAKLY